MSFIRQNIYIGGKKDAENYAWLTKNNIKCVVNCAKEISNMRKYPGISYLHLQLRDQHDQCILKLINDGLRFMRNNKNKRILVNCQMGMSRSVSMALAYLMLENNWDYQYTLDYIQKRRKIADPNDSFRLQLQTLRKYYPNFHCARLCKICIKRNMQKERARLYARRAHLKKLSAIKNRPRMIKNEPLPRRCL